MNAGSLFTGIGGLDLALERSGVEIAWQAEKDKYCAGVLTRYWPDVPLFGDVREITATSVEPVNIIVGGFPCQDLSTAGRRKGLAGERSGLFFEFARILGELRPEWTIIENVPGLLSSNEGRDMGIVIGTLVELGYRVAYRVLDAQYLGVPQRRRRVFIVGHLGDWRGPVEILFEREGGGGNSQASRKEGTEVAGTLGSCTGGSRTTDLDGHGAYIVNALTSRASRNDAEDPYIFVQNSRSEVRLHGGDGQSVGALASQFGVQQQPYLSQMAGVRRLTPLEWERLQGFPDNWTEGQSDAQRYRQLGNAVAVPVVEWIAKRLVRVATSPQPNS